MQFFEVGVYHLNTQYYYFKISTSISNKTQERVMHLLDQDILLHPGYTAGRAGGANPAAGHGMTPGPGPGTVDLNNH